jgi:hypothetical protein
VGPSVIRIRGWPGQFWTKYGPVLPIEIILTSLYSYYYYYYYYYYCCCLLLGTVVLLWGTSL